ncbi:hypothetical protein [Streptomyces sp. NPDC058595]|uniref:hypothetical protein n=1 Tax=Streptomyces sp. NPDC058595 TaxID=3346550 RepID=UPI003650CE3D
MFEEDTAGLRERDGSPAVGRGAFVGPTPSPPGPMSEESGSDLNLEDAEKQRAAIMWCAPSFEEFAHRFWVENRLWHAVNARELPRLEPQLQDYLNHYAPPEAPM